MKCVSQIWLVITLQNYLRKQKKSDFQCLFLNSILSFNKKIMWFNTHFNRCDFNQKSNVDVYVKRNAENVLKLIINKKFSHTHSLRLWKKINWIFLFWGFVIKELISYKKLIIILRQNEKKINKCLDSFFISNWSVQKRCEANLPMCLRDLNHVLNVNNAILLQEVLCGYPLRDKKLCT